MFTLQELKTTDKIIVAGHRGYSGRFPENSLLAFREAAEAGCDMIELDVTLSKDGVPVISHDDCLERVSDGSGMIADHTCEELKEFDLVSAMEKRFGESGFLRFGSRWNCSGNIQEYCLT